MSAALAAAGADVAVHDDLGSVSVVSPGIARRPEIPARALAALDAAGVEPRFVTTTPGRVSLHLPATDVHDAVRLLHDVFISGAADGSATVTELHRAGAQSAA